MDTKHSITKVALVGSTQLTRKGIVALNNLPNIDIQLVLGLDDAAGAQKANYVRLDKFLNSFVEPPLLSKDNSWENFGQSCQILNIDLIISLGDSRIIPEHIVKSFNIIGNHGAPLPDVQGGASLVWGRLLNSGEWGISIMEIDKKIDAGRILKLKRFGYDQKCSETEFAKKCDDLTINALVEVLQGNYTPIANRKWDVKISKHTDSAKTIDILKYCLDNGLNVYLPPRTPADGIVKAYWSQSFIDVFKIANDTPYPQWTSSED